MTDKGDRGWRPEVQLYVAEYGTDDGRQAMLAFHTLAEATDWLAQMIGTCDEPADLELSQERSRFWTWDDGGWGNGGMGYWAEVRQVRVSQPRRLLRDDRSDN